MDGQRTRRGFLAAAGLATLAGCAGGLGGAGPSARAVAGDPATATPAPGNEAGLPPTAERSLPLPMAADALRREVVSGGPRKDGIPAIDDPSFVDAATADERLEDDDVVFGVTRGDVAKAYPQDVLVWHEIVNDVLDGDPVAVTYCPLTGTAQGFERGPTTFGVSGRLVNNNLVMYDRATEHWWPQVLSTAIPGPWNSRHAGRSLVEFRAVWTRWTRWRARHPTTRVLSTDTGYARNYGQDPYGSYTPKRGYYTSGSTLFPRLNPDDRFDPKLVVLGVRTPAGAAAFPKPILRDRGLVTGAIGGRPLLAVHDPALDTGYAYWNPEAVSFEARDGAVVGPAGRHPPADLPLEPALAFDAMWFAWSGFYPGTSVHG